MYQFSRAIYRELANEVIEGHVPCGAEGSNRQHVLRTCERTVERMGTDRYHFAHPTRTLIRELRPYFPLAAQRHMRHVVEHYIGAADRYLLEQLETGYDLAGRPLGCRATTRRGEPCQRAPIPYNGYCPSHQHLADAQDDLRRVIAA